MLSPQTIMARSFRLTVIKSNSDQCLDRCQIGINAYGHHKRVCSAEFAMSMYEYVFPHAGEFSSGIKSQI